MPKAIEFEWRKIEEFPNYEITSLGYIRRRGSREQHSTQDIDRVTTAMLSKDGKRYHRSVGALVKATFPGVVW